MSPTAKPEPNSAGFQSYAVRADAGPGSAGRHRKVAADVADLKSIEAPPVELPPGDAEREALSEVLVEHGCTPTQALVDRLDSLTNRIAFVRTAETLRHVIRSLEATPAGRALERALLGSDGRTFAADAREAGCSRQNLQKTEAKLRQRLSRLTTGTIV